MSDIAKDVGFKIREIRQERGLTQEELAALADLRRAYLGQIENGETNVGLMSRRETAQAIASRNHSEDKQRDRGIPSPVAHNVVDFAFIIGYAGRRGATVIGVFLHRPHGQELDAQIDDAAAIEQQVLCEAGWRVHLR